MPGVSPEMYGSHPPEVNAGTLEQLGALLLAYEVDADPDEVSGIFELLDRSPTSVYVGRTSDDRRFIVSKDHLGAFIVSVAKEPDRGRHQGVA